MKVTVPHTHGKEKATELAKNFLKKLKEEHGGKVSNLNEKWDENSGDYSCNFNGLNLAAHIEVKDDEVVVDGKIPFFALPLSGVIEDAIRQSMEKALK